jgi:NADH-quinone oxidoreductase subunit J
MVAVLGAVASPVYAADNATAMEHRAGVTDAAAPGGALETVLFFGVAGATVVAALGVCIAKNIVRMAVWLFVALGSVALLYFLLAANFLGAIQLIVYAGGTLVLLIFGVMLTSKSPWVRYTPGKLEIAAAATVCGALLAALCVALYRAAWPATEAVVHGTAVADLGRGLMTTYLVPFEVAGVLLMIVMVGAAHLARQEK